MRRRVLRQRTFWQLGYRNLQLRSFRYPARNLGLRSLVIVIAVRGDLVNEVRNEVIAVSPSRFSLLMGIDEEDVEDVEEAEDTTGVLEEGELVEEKESSKAPMTTKAQRPTGVQGSKSSTKKKIVRAKDLKFGGVQYQTKKSSIRKI